MPANRVLSKANESGRLRDTSSGRQRIPRSRPNTASATDHVSKASGSKPGISPEGQKIARVENTPSD